MEVRLGGADSLSLASFTFNSASFRTGNAGGGTWRRIADNWTRLHWRNAWDCQLSQQRYNSVQAFLLAAEKCDLAGCGDCVE
jgi:hypothetical protein